MNTKTNRLITYALLTILLVVCMLSLGGRRGGDPSTAIAIHSATGSLMIIGSAAHLARKRKWIRAVFSRSAGKLPVAVSRNRGVDIGMAITLALTTFSGLWIIIEPNAAAMQKMHGLSGLVFTGLLVAHLAMHARWVSSAIRGRATSRELN